MKYPARVGMALTAVMLLLSFEDAQAAIPQHERDALIALYNSTNGPNWLSNTGWLGAPGTECGWYGVTCDETEASVIRIMLRQNQLNGPIPSGLANISNLQRLYLESNQLSGSIPVELGNLTNLLVLYLYSNQLGGNIPAGKASFFL
jgi:Leucine-rich repeat (LRR) protein